MTQHEVPYVFLRQDDKLAGLNAAACCRRVTGLTTCKKTSGKSYVAGYAAFTVTAHFERGKRT